MEQTASWGAASCSAIPLYVDPTSFSRSPCLSFIFTELNFKMSIFFYNWDIMYESVEGWKKNCVKNLLKDWGKSQTIKMQVSNPLLLSVESPSYCYAKLLSGTLL
jgi:hypothetical protein